jgi:signal transduction histidine kinase
LKDRVEALDGMFEVESTPAVGTRVRADFPLLPDRPEVPA